MSPARHPSGAVPTFAEDKTLLLLSQVQALPSPCARDLGTLQGWLDRPEGGDFFLQGCEADAWTDGNDLVTISRYHTDKDRLTGLISHIVVPFYHFLRYRWSKVDAMALICNTS